MTALSDGIPFNAQIKLAALAVHAEEYLDNYASPLVESRRAAVFDIDSIRGLLSDPDVRAVLDDPTNAVLLPVKRSEGDSE